MPTDPYYDLNIVTSLQKYLTNGVGSSIDGATLGNISQSLNNLNNAISGSGYTLNGIFNHQQEMTGILEREKDRINRKKDTIESAYVGKQRAVVLNESYRLRYRQIFKIILVIIVTLILFILITYMSKTYPFIPSSVFEILTIFVISVGIFSVYFLTINMIKRSKVNFDQLAIPGPLKGNIVGQLDQKNKNKSMQDLLRDTNMDFCVGSDCCAYGTIWDTGNSTCIAGNKVVQKFTTVSGSYELGEFSGTLPIRSNSPNEFSEYTLVK